MESAGGSYGDYPESIDISPTDANTIGTEALSDSDESVMERGDSMRLKRRRSSAVRHIDGTDDRDAVGEAGSSRPQHRRGKK